MHKLAARGDDLERDVGQPAWIGREGEHRTGELHHRLVDGPLHIAAEGGDSLVVCAVWLIPHPGGLGCGAALRPGGA